MLSDTVKQWLVENAMGPMFMLSELERQTGVFCTLENNCVTFDKGKSTHPVAVDLHNKTLRIGTWEEVATKAEVKTPTPTPEVKEVVNQKSTDVPPAQKTEVKNDVKTN